MSSVAIVSAHGDIDGTNASTLTDFTIASAVHCRALILDLCDVEFIGSEGFSALLNVSVSCSRAGTGWVMVPSAAVSRLLRICDHHGSLPAVDNVDAALANLLELAGGCMAAPPPRSSGDVYPVGECQSVDDLQR
jgi:anti-anti-sigma factor